MADINDQNANATEPFGPKKDAAGQKRRLSANTREIYAARVRTFIGSQHTHDMDWRAAWAKAVTYIAESTTPSGTQPADLVPRIDEICLLTLGCRINHVNVSTMAKAQAGSRHHFKTKYMIARFCASLLLTEAESAPFLPAGEKVDDILQAWDKINRRVPTQVVPASSSPTSPATGVTPEVEAPALPAVQDAPAVAVQAALPFPVDPAGLDECSETPVSERECREVPALPLEDVPIHPEEAASPTATHLVSFSAEGYAALQAMAAFANRTVEQVAEGFVLRRHQDILAAIPVSEAQ